MAESTRHAGGKTTGKAVAKLGGPAHRGGNFSVISRADALAYTKVRNVHARSIADQASYPGGHARASGQRGGHRCDPGSVLTSESGYVGGYASPPSRPPRSPEKEKPPELPGVLLSGRRDLNPRRSPWQGEPWDRDFNGLAELEAAKGPERTREALKSLPRLPHYYLMLDATTSCGGEVYQEQKRE